MHDYLLLHKNWYKGFVNFGNDFEIAMNKILNPDKSRYRDWTLWPHDSSVDEIIADNACLLPYDVSNLSKYMYISGAYWVAKKYVMEEFPLNENLVWGKVKMLSGQKELEKYTNSVLTSTLKRSFKKLKIHNLKKFRKSNLKNI